jgi:L-ascorbate metabolism protein UlaG (beta-lactamase superfamily)
LSIAGGLIIILSREEKMLRIISLLLCLFFICGASSFGQTFEEDEIPTSQGPLRITFIGHASLMLRWNNRIIQVDPVSQFADYTQFPKADLILITHEHFDHFDLKAIATLSHEKTVVILTEKCAAKFSAGKIMSNGQTTTINGIAIEAVPAYNIVHMRSQGVPYHPKGEGNGYVLTLADKNIYIAGDTENIPEMKNLKAIDIAFLPMNLPYTMTPEMVAEAARAIRPKVLYPYHYGETDTSQLLALLKDEKGIEVRIRRMK